MSNPRAQLAFLCVALVTCPSLQSSRSSASDRNHYVVIGKAQNNSTVKLDISQALLIQLRWQPGTGYSWSPLAPAESICKIEKLSAEQVKQLTGEGVLREIAPDKAIPGTFEQQVFLVTPLSEGATVVHLQYLQRWNPDSVDQRFNVKVSIASK